nr:hypothetical protein [Pseudomonas syringae]
MGDCLSWEAGTRLERDVDAAIPGRSVRRIRTGGGELTLKGGLEKGFKVKGNRPTDCRSAGRLPWFQIRRLRLSIGIFVCGTSTRLT